MHVYVGRCGPRLTYSCSIVLQTSRKTFRTGLNRLFTTRPDTDAEVAAALEGLGWKKQHAVFANGPGTAPHCLELEGAAPQGGKFIVAPDKAQGAPSSIDLQSESGGEFQGLLRKCLEFHPCILDMFTEFLLLSVN